MHGKKVVSDYEINGSVRRELTARGLDISQIRYRTSGGSVEVSGILHFKEPKSPAQVIKELFLLDSAIAGIRGVKRVKMQFDGFEKQSGKWGVDMKAKNKEEAEKKDDSKSE